MGRPLTSDDASRVGELILRHRPLRPGTSPDKLSHFEDAVWHLAPPIPTPTRRSTRSAGTTGPPS